MSAVRWLISGRVQGVGFRWFALRRAQSLGVTGWVTNLADGRVEIVAGGDQERLEAFEQAIRKGPAPARVETVERGDYPHEGGIGNTFTIK